MDLTKIVTENHGVIIIGSGMRGKEVIQALKTLEDHQIPYVVTSIGKKDLASEKEYLFLEDPFLTTERLGMNVVKDLNLEIEKFHEEFIIFEQTKKSKQPKYFEKPNNYQSPIIIKQKFYRKTKL
jgi:hypothetical protein